MWSDQSVLILLYFWVDGRPSQNGQPVNQPAIYKFLMFPYSRYDGRKVSGITNNTYIFQWSSTFSICICYGDHLFVLQTFQPKRYVVFLPCKCRAIHYWVYTQKHMTTSINTANKPINCTFARHTKPFGNSRARAHLNPIMTDDDDDVVSATLTQTHKSCNYLITPSLSLSLAVIMLPEHRRIRNSSNVSH